MDQETSGPTPPGPDQPFAGVSPWQENVLERAIELIRQYAGPGRFALAVAGSRGKGISDSGSDVDLRVYADQWTVAEWPHQPDPAAMQRLIVESKKAGCPLDFVWPRLIGGVDAELDRWCAGEIAPMQVPWTLWGYHLPTDLYNQRAVLDPDGVVADWRKRLDVYPEPLKQALLTQHLAVLRHWRNDYHYASKVARSDAVFLASLTAKIVHSALQVLYAVNHVYYPGDGWNLAYIDTFKHSTEGLRCRIEGCLYPESGPQRHTEQYENTLWLIDQIEACVGAANLR